MDELTTLSLDLKPRTVIRGETVGFEAVLKNISKDLLQDLVPMLPRVDALELSLEGPAFSATATGELGAGHRHMPLEPEHLVNLAPGKELRSSGNLLRWFGELPPGKYKVTAHYTGMLGGPSSEPVELTVLAAAPVFASTPRYGSRGVGTCATAAWAHAAGASTLLFYQQQNPSIPRLHYHGIRVAEIKTKDPVPVYAATLPGAELERGHLLWLDEKQRLQLAVVNTEKPALSPGVPLETPFKGEMLESPLTHPNGSVLVLFCDAKREKVALLSVDAAGGVKAENLDLQRAKTLGAHVCFWESDVRLHFFWAAPRGREVFLGQVPLDDLASGFAIRSVHVADDPIVWLDAYLDMNAQFKDGPYLEELTPPDQKDKPPPSSGPKLIAWCVTASAGGLRCTRVNVTDNRQEVVVTFPVSEIKGPEIIGSATDYDYNFCLLVKDAEGVLYYGSTTRGGMAPVAKICGQDITVDQFPGLITATKTGLFPWTYLRYVKEKNAIDYIRLEPADTPDPIEGGTGGGARKRR